MSILLPQCIPPEYQEKAQEICSYLVQIRGGAPFLSGADGKLLVQWLDDQIPVVAILTAIDQVSQKRQAKPVRSRMSLHVCKGTLKKLITKKAKKTERKTKKNPPNVTTIGLLSLLPSIQQLQVPAELVDAQKSLVDSLKQIVETYPDDHQGQADHAIQACLRFHDAVWIATQDEHDQIQQEAEQELEALRSIFSPLKWQESVAEVMRAKLRMRYPAISAQAIWNALNQSS